ncbi:Predicted nucleic acid-binding protein, contains PIN domain [Modestobacter sp. DSM 44400]|uniref:type II toxin-antitoxin system VapC family toxin n=1 Tax=Modestobacter sp. DSM 44400 TaxID=1550230 RepID=UPI00089BF939|nr:type II toxin-antitoxin system VapC family toxin [Modestobacter sp. DSM 44400]SDX94253.1 Predicted nucleic acid-binding protein, contains PIN domain [Modestobacter sp. DSM 44400]
MIVVDCSALVDVLSGAAGTEELRARLAGDELSAPQLLDYEVVSALRGMLRRGSITAGRAANVLTDYQSLAVERWPADDALRRRALQLRDDVTAYDAAYVALAEALDCPLITRDARLARSSGHGVVIQVH